MTPFHYIPGSIPLLISIPHAGTSLTKEVETGLTNEAKSLPDTDWHVKRLYQFALDMGAHMIVANYSRFVIDLNRPADDQPLYNTATTGLFPTTLFNGSPVYKDGQAPSAETRKEYLKQIWIPYHQQIQSVLTQFKDEFGYAVLFDAHSIASCIPRLFDGPLPDLNIGTNTDKSCKSQTVTELKNYCLSQNYSWIINGRFKGGHITRAYGLPEQHQHAMQLELAQTNYMTEKPPFSWDQKKASQLMPVLKNIVTLFYQSVAEQYSQVSE
ncbi:N-formylglutamate deformylase [Vibrio salinus]|uniref:N-formylglutamate deformylase n=1 Tax=Vibrio salinus TaxID=2899784 RepID=UPI001E5CDE87|nr:N-formylglutamate deformylase [Vibrio salinus]MCE0492790.1 N-formylglutamate deformylase [Vibrio salinus]